MGHPAFLLWSLALAAGLLLSTTVSLPFNLLLVLAVSLFVMVLVAHWRGHSVVFQVLVCMFFFLVGMLRANGGDLQLLPECVRVWSAHLSALAQARLELLFGDSGTGAIVKAMLLGKRAGLSQEVRQLYAATGAAHVLALSGLHLSILFALLNYWMMRMLTHRVMRCILGFSGLFLVWGYALLTGFSPSLTRAAVMMSLILLSQMRLCGTNGWHALGVAAMLMLLATPSSLWSVGFQLSFTAVAGLLLFYGPLQGLWKARNKVVRWLWRGWAASLAAQLGSLPLSVYYFHYVAIYGILFSPLYLLGAVLILYAALAAIVFGGWTTVAVTVVVSAQHALMSFASVLPGAQWSGLYPSATSVLLGYVALSCMAPVMQGIGESDTEVPRQRLAMVVRQWPYIVAAAVCLLFAYVAQH